MNKKTKKKYNRKNIKLVNIKIDNDLELFEQNDSSIKFLKQKHKHNISKYEFQKGRILRIYSNNIAKVDLDNKVIKAYIKGNLKQLSAESQNLLAVGDFVNLIKEKNNFIIHSLLERKNSLYRIVNNDAIVIAANVDQVIITVSYKEPDLNLGLVDRYICAAEIQDIEPVICINKIDLCDNHNQLEEQVFWYKNNGYKIIFVSAEDNIGITELKAILKDKESVFSGHSGVGKSSIINRLQPDLNLRTANISYVHNKGKHTTTSSKIIKWDFGGFLIDTPGIKTFGLRKEDIYEISKTFPGFKNYLCQFNNCSHTHEENCGVKDAVEKGLIPEERYDSYLRIYESLRR